MNKEKFRIITHGCRTNQYESQAFREQLEQLGLEDAEDSVADVCVINSCTVTKQADKSSLRSVRQVLQANSRARVVVTGCMAESKKAQLQAMGVHVVTNDQKETAVAHLFPDLETLPEFSIKKFEAHTRAFVKVQDGCNSFCTYCIIPYVRGRSRSKPLTVVIEEVKNLINNGYQEVVITGINVGDYTDGVYSLADLIRAVDQVEGIKRVRLSSIDPDEVNDDLLSAIVEGKNTCPSMHIVLQSGSNIVLKRMNRKYTRQIFYQTIEKLKERNPDFTFTTDVIVGFPQETEEDFNQTLEVIERVQFAKTHIFPFSPRERTRAFSYPQIVPEVINERKKTLEIAAKNAAFAMREKFIGRKLTILVEESGQEVKGHTEHFLFVTGYGKKVPPNRFVSVEIEKNLSDCLYGRIL